MVLKEREQESYDPTAYIAIRRQDSNSGSVHKMYNLVVLCNKEKKSNTSLLGSVLVCRTIRLPVEGDGDACCANIVHTRGPP